MVKGTTRQVMVVKTGDTELFEQAIFLLKEEALEKQGISEGQLLEEAKRLSQVPLKKRVKHKSVHTLPPLVWSGIGAALTAIVWLITVIG